MADKVFVGFGFGAIQAGLFCYEAHRSGNFGRLVVAEVMGEVVEAVRRSGGTYVLNVATRSGIEKHKITGVEIYNPRVPQDREALIAAIAEASELSTALPSVKFYGNGSEGDVVDLLSRGLKRKTELSGRPRTIIYTGENNNHAAEILEAALVKVLGDSAAKTSGYYQCLNTVIGKMSGIVTDASEIEAQQLERVVTGLLRAFLVEEFNRILITKVKWSDFDRGIRVFEEKTDLLPFEEAKLFGHNATHAMLGYLLKLKGCEFMSDAAGDAALLKLATDAFLHESGEALCRKYRGVDALFTPHGFKAYVDDLMVRMVNPYLRDRVDRITRDSHRKLGWDDRLVGTMRLVLGQGLIPTRYAAGAAAALRGLEGETGRTGTELLDEIWQESTATDAEKQQVKDLIDKAKTVA